MQQIKSILMLVKLWTQILAFVRAITWACCCINLLSVRAFH
jgi:hypothetical protein